MCLRFATRHQYTRFLDVLWACGVWWWLYVSVSTKAAFSVLPSSECSLARTFCSPSFTIDSLDHFFPLKTTAMFFCKCQALTVFTVCFLVRTVVHSIRKCGQDICRDDQVCCAQGTNTTTVTCCKQFVDKTYYNIAMVTRKLSGVLIMLLLFAVGYFVQRVLCSRARQLTPPHSGHPTVTTSQDPLMEGSTPDSSMDPTRAAQLPSYDDCKRLPTYEETVRDGSRGRPECSMGQTTWRGRWLD